MKEDVRAIHPNPKHIPIHNIGTLEKTEILDPVQQAEFQEDIDQLITVLDTSYQDYQSYLDLCNKLRDAIDDKTKGKVRNRLHQILNEIDDAIETEQE
ncbi:MAG: hypothetical protein DRR19_31150, partial [Candidatus Parabeggiatoa sp. nov. 1]